MKRNISQTFIYQRWLPRIEFTLLELVLQPQSMTLLEKNSIDQHQNTTYASLAGDQSPTRPT